MPLGENTKDLVHTSDLGMFTSYEKGKVVVVVIRDHFADLKSQEPLLPPSVLVWWTVTLSLAMPRHERRLCSTKDARIKRGKEIRHWAGLKIDILRVG